MSAAFFTFPLCVLAMPLDEKQILLRIVSHGIERAGAGAGAAEIEDHRVESYLDGKAIGFNRSHRHQLLVRGAIICNVSLGSLPATVQQCDETQKFIAVRQQAHGTDPLVFIATELLWSCYNDDGFSFRDFSTLCAINSIIGFKTVPVLIRRGMIVARQLGFKTQKVMQAELAKRSTVRRPLTVQELRTSLDRLETRDLIRRCQASPRSVYFSTKLDHQELRLAVKQRLEIKRRVHVNRASDRELFDGNQSATTEQPLKKDQPDGNQSATTEQPRSNH